MAPNKTCRNCYFWSKENWEKEKAWPHNPEGYDYVRGQCLRAIHANNDSFSPSSRKEVKKCPIITVDGSGFFSVVYTLPDFGCSEWRRKDGS